MGNRLKVPNPLPPREAMGAPKKSEEPPETRTQRRMEARAELGRRLALERCRYYTPNGGIERFLAKLAAEIPPGDKRIHIVVLRAGNGLGKTALAANLAAYLCNRHPQPWFDRVPFLKEYRSPCKGRIMTTATAAEEAYDEEFEKWLPQGKYRGAKGGHKFYQNYEFPEKKSGFDIFTFDQAPGQGESTTLDWAIVDEPCPRKHFSALKSRLRFGGVIFFILTALEGSGWYKRKFEKPARLAPGGDVHVMELSAEENCRQHGVRGLLDHDTLESMWEDFDENELPARKDGKYMPTAGIVYTSYRDVEWRAEGESKVVGHVMTRLDGYHLDCYNAGAFTLYNVVDPHDRKPYAVGWDLVFPNGDVVRAAEWPDDSMRPFHETRSCSWEPLTYAKMIKATELGLAGRPADVRLMDPNFGNAPKGTTKETMAEAMKAAGEHPEVDWPLEFHTIINDDIKQGHIAVKSLIGDPARGVRPKRFVMAHCSNTRFGYNEYGYKENRTEAAGLSERPELQFKGLMDLDRYGAIFGYQYMRVIERGSQEYEQREAARRARFNPKRVGSYVGMAG